MVTEPDDLLSGIWTRIERVLAAHAPEVLETLAPGASPDEIAELEKGIGLALPSDLRRLLEIHNGQQDPSQCVKFCGIMGLLPTAEILENWKMLTEIAIDFDRQNGVYSPEKNSLNADWWRRSCIPFGHSNGYFTCVDMSPEGGPAGRIVEFTHSSPMEETNMPSFADWLGRVAAALEAGRFDRESYGFFSVHPEFAWKW